MGCASCKPIEPKTNHVNTHRYPVRRDVLSLYNTGNKVKNMNRLIYSGKIQPVDTSAYPVRKNQPSFYQSGIKVQNINRLINSDEEPPIAGENTNPVDTRRNPTRRDVPSFYHTGNQVKNINRFINSVNESLVVGDNNTNYETGVVNNNDLPISIEESDNTNNENIVDNNQELSVDIEDSENNNNSGNVRINPNSYAFHSNTPENIILYWEASRKTEKYHWWPLLNDNPEQEDPVNNLFAKGGGLHKYGILCDNLALEYQKTYYSILPDSNRSDKKWAGFCDRASYLSCLYPYPCKPVTAKFGNKTMEFMPEDIEALMICASENATRKGKTVIFGQRNNMRKKDYTKMDPQKRKLIKSEPLPLDLLDILGILTSELTPFVMDIDNGEAVWNYPFDKVTIKKKRNKEYREILPSKGENTVYEFILESSGYPEKNMYLVGYVNKYHNFIDQGWIGDKNPDFLWRQYKQEGPWIGKCDLNPYVDAYHVYRIYLQSISQQNKIVKLTL